MVPVIVAPSSRRDTGDGEREGELERVEVKGLEGHDVGRRIQIT
jgi:hypothetical protein